MFSPRKSCYNFLNADAGQTWASWVVLVVKNPPASAGDIREAGLILGSERSPGGENGNPFHLENPMEGYSP